ncbi:hypothetical protein [Clostridium luticellarii]|jgi:cobalt/nickel transport protein|uniref:Uncharacterized protein n=1 Tax=Clostridium luticellarii TaxID=1691940 RepID=A0A2T0BEN9_9CLOT|nr:hypothetical protein [Clostridium luticellarii]MCI1944840.1 hypothetical protein [Clostridium luticellarii]MCI1968344.1 hypothetical protein [Clostridium luticellarii]MCI1995342.1 hypothetical protein [Clostridium luticellarii]MCI2039396.1 hypothetical protein [Clostridium luticellarii]PRR82366.1 hypothetical protein CLLU_28740 [Clostridium luticellarii]
MESSSNTKSGRGTSIKFLDKFTRVMLAVMIILFIFIFGASKYMVNHKMEAGGTDDKVNTMASNNHKPFIELPGDAQVGAFSVANFFAGLIVGHHWEKLFGESAKNKKSLKEE